MMEKIMTVIQLMAMFVTIVCAVVSEVNCRKAERDLEKMHKIQLDIITGEANDGF